MNVKRALVFTGKELRQGPRATLFVWVVALPVVMTLLVRLVFGGLIDQRPTVGIIDRGESRLTALALRDPTIVASLLDEQTDLRALVAEHTYDAGLVLSETFDQQIASGESPLLDLFFSGQSRANDQLVLSVSIIDLVREVAGQRSAIEVENVVLGEGRALPIQDRLIPLLVLVAVSFAGIFLPAASILQEKQDGTLLAALVTPTTAGEIMVAKAVVGFLLSFGVGALTLALNGIAFETALSVMVVLVVASLMCVTIGLLIGSLVGDVATMFSVWKGGGLVLFAPAVLFLFPGVAEWIALIFPTYYFLGPLFEIATEGATLGNVWQELMVAALLTVLLGFGCRAAVRRMELQLASA